MKITAKIWENCTLAELVYGAQTWACTKTNIKTMQKTQRMERSILEVRKKE